MTHDDRATIVDTRDDSNGTTYRAVVLPDDYAGEPDGDCYGTILRRTWSGGRYVYDVAHADYGTGAAAGELADRLTTAHDYGDGSAVDVALTRAAVDWHDFVSHVDRSGDDYLAVVTADTLARWGCDPDTVDNPARSAAHDWQAWIDGDVYVVTVERRVTWSADGYDDRDTWESVDMVGGFYGDAYAAEAARDMLADVVDATTPA